MNPVAVAVLSADPVTGEGALTLLSSYPQLTLVRADRPEQAAVLLILADEVTEELLARMELATARGDHPRALPVVMVAADIMAHHLRRAVDAGLVSLLRRRETDFARIVDAVVAVGTGRAPRPETVPRILMDRVRPIGSDSPTRPASTVDGLAPRDIEVLRLLSDGLDTGEVALKLNYSERTVKNIIRGVLDRCQLRNRTHAVAYALSRGVL